jgi:hypothetical protein
MVALTGAALGPLGRSRSTPARGAGPAGSGLPASEFNLAGISRTVAEHSQVIWVLLNYVA